VNISATLHYGATWYQAHASAAKAAVDSLTRSLALEWGEFGIRVVGVAPGPVADTAGFSKLGGDMAKDVGRVAKFQIPLGRLGTKFDVAMACVFLCSSAASNVTGDTLVVDGGAWLGRQPFAPREVVRSFSRQVESSSRSAGLAPSDTTRSKL